MSRCRSVIRGVLPSGVFSPASSGTYLAMGSSRESWPVATTYVAKLDFRGKLVYATYLGGSGADGANGIAVDSRVAPTSSARRCRRTFRSRMFQPLSLSGGAGYQAFRRTSDGSIAARTRPTSAAATGTSATGSPWDNRGCAYVTGATRFTRTSEDEPHPKNTPGLGRLRDEAERRRYRVALLDVRGRRRQRLRRRHRRRSERATGHHGHTDSVDFPVVNQSNRRFTAVCRTRSSSSLPRPEPR